MGLLIGAAFGAVFLLANSGAPVTTAVGAVIKAVGVGCLLLVIWAQATTPQADTVDRPSFGRAFRLVVAAEVAGGVGGLIVLRLAGAPEQANVGWIALVVGLHFVALAVVWRDLGISVVGAVMATAGAVGLAMAAAGAAVAWIPVVSGVVSGVALLTGSVATSLAQRRPTPMMRHRAQATGPVRR